MGLAMERMLRIIKVLVQEGKTCRHWKYRYAQSVQFVSLALIDSFLSLQQSISYTTCRLCQAGPSKRGETLSQRGVVRNG